MNRNPVFLVIVSCLLCVQTGAGTPPADTPLTPASADTQWQFIGVRNGLECPLAEQAVGTIWQTDQLFRIGVAEIPPGLENYCVYTATSFNPDNGPDTQPVESLRCNFRQPPCLSALSEDSLSVAYMGATPQDLEDIMAPDLRGHFLAQAGRFVTWDNDQRVRLSVIDTEPAGAGQDQDGPGNSQHGFALLNLARDLLCQPGNNCGVQLYSGLGLPRVFCGTEPSGLCVDTVNGGYVGTIGDLAVAIRAQIRHWQETGAGTRLVINLSVAWDGLFNQDDAGDTRTAAGAVKAALQDASCRGALIIAATGNGQSGPTTAVGPMYPAGWEQDAAPDETECGNRINEPLDPGDFANPGDYQPLVHAVSAVDTFSRPVTPRISAQSRLAAFGDHAVTDADYDGVVGPTPVLTGTSVSAAVVSAAAAAVWYHRPDLAGWEVMDAIHSSGKLLRDDSGNPQLADFCLDTGGPFCPGARRARICDAVAAACDDPAASCPPFSCPGRNAYLPAFDIEEIITRFATVDAYDVSLATMVATVSECGPGYKLFWDTGAQPVNPCPQRQFYAVQATPWTDGQPSGQPCELCTSAAQSPGVLYIEIKDAFQGALRDLTLVCGGDPTVSPGPFDAYRIATPAPLTGTGKFKLLNLPTRCETDGLLLTYSVDAVGNGPAVSTVSTVLTATDRDGDTIKDNEDNCLLVANDQSDTDGDGIGNRCDPDIAVPNDCTVDFFDLISFRGAFLSAPGDAQWNPDADLNSDLIVNFGDIVLLRDFVFGPPGPSGVPNLCD